jgi:hypothetical protein
MFHDKLCRPWSSIRRAAPATSLYVSLELMKRLEGEVLDFLKSSASRTSRCRPCIRASSAALRRTRAPTHRRAGAVDRYIQWWFRTRQSTAFADPVLDEMDESSRATRCCL